MDPAELERARLEREITHALRQLPQPRAPRTLALRVMQAIATGEAGAQVVAARAGWRAWPLALQLLALILVVSAGYAAVWMWPVADAWLSAAAPPAAPVETGTSLLSRGLANLMAMKIAADLVWRSFLQPIATPAIVILAVMCAASALFGAALKHVAWEGRRTFHS